MERDAIEAIWAGENSDQILSILGIRDRKMTACMKELMELKKYRV